MGGYLSLLVASTVTLAVSTTPAADTVGPNGFGFSRSEFFVPKGSTNATLSVGFSPGNRGWSGAIGYQASDGSAKAGVDYSPAQGTLYFNGPPNREIQVPLHPSEASGPQTFYVQLQPFGSDYVYGVNPASVHLVDNTNGVISFASAQQQVSSTAGVANVQVVRTGSTNGTISISYATDIFASSANYGQDYQHTTGTLTFDPGVTEQTIPITILDSGRTEPRTVRLRLSEEFGPDFHLGRKEMDLVITTSTPQLVIARENGQVQISWAQTPKSYMLERASDISFSDAETIAHVSNGSVCAASEQCRGVGFYRLK